jgi:hypothetical protein
MGLTCGGAPNICSRQKLYVAGLGSSVRYYKTGQDYNIYAPMVSLLLGIRIPL